MKSFVPKIAAIHDLSCIGRCSLTTIIPILSCMGIQTCPLPTALLSTHLGGFGRPAFYDFTEYMPKFSQHWKQEGILFDCIYSGFLASEEQIGVVGNFIDEFSKHHPLVVVDPVMGDGGKLYSIYTPQMQMKMKLLIKKADIITPNYTEACFLLGEPYEEKHCTIKKMQEWLIRLSDLGPSIVVMTGIIVDEKKIINLGYDRKAGAFWEVSKDYIAAQYPGTGDIFASVLLGSLLKGNPLCAAMEQASDFVATAIKATFDACTPKREGVLLECALPRLCQNR